jgi:hypothetical protein
MSEITEPAGIQYIPAHALDNPTHYQLMRTTVDRAKADAAVMKLAKPAVLQLEAAVQEEEKALKIAQKNPLSDQIKAVDDRRDHTYQFFKETVRVSMKNPSEAKQASGQRIFGVIKNYGIKVGDQYDRETGLMENMLNDVERDYMDDVRALDLEETVRSLRADNTLFYDLLNQRTASQMQKETGAMRKARTQCDQCYAALRKQINALSTLGNRVLDNFITFMNLEINRLKQQVLHKHGVEINTGGGDNNTGGNDDGEEDQPQG